MYMFIIIGQEGILVKSQPLTGLLSNSKQKGIRFPGGCGAHQVEPSDKDTPKEHKNGGVEDHVPF